MRQAVKLERGGDALVWHALSLLEGGSWTKGAASPRKPSPGTRSASGPSGLAGLPIYSWGISARSSSDSGTPFSASALDVPFAAWWLAQAEDYAGHREAAIPLYENVEAMQVPVFSDASRLARLALTGNREAALALLDAGPLRQIARTDEEHSDRSANSLAPLGEIDEALAWLDQSISWIFVEPGFHRFNPHLEPVRRARDLTSSCSRRSGGSGRSLPPSDVGCHIAPTRWNSGVARRRPTSDPPATTLPFSCLFRATTRGNSQQLAVRRGRWATY